MKIRPTDPFGSPPEPEDVKNSGKPGFSIEEGSREETPAAARGAETGGVSGEAAILGKAPNPTELGERLVDLALNDVAGSFPQADLDQIRGLLNGQVRDDPFLQEKFQRIFSLIGKSR